MSVLEVQFFGSPHSYEMTYGAVCALIQYIVIYICFEFEEKKHHFFQLQRA